MTPKKLEDVPDLVNTYYAFVLTVYAFALYIGNHSHLFWQSLFLATPLLAAWAGFQFRDFYTRRTQRHGFRVVSDVMTYEIVNKRESTLRFDTRLKAGTDHLMVYPIGYQWDGTNESTPKIRGNGQRLLGPVGTGDVQQKINYINQTESAEGDWHYWYIALNPAVHKGDIVDISYSQELQDNKNTAKPSLYYFVRVPMGQLELTVKFGAVRPRSITGSFVKSSDRSRPHIVEGVRFDTTTNSATWTIEKPKKGYCYRVDWQ